MTRKLLFVLLGIVLAIISAVVVIVVAPNFDPERSFRDDTDRVRQQTTPSGSTMIGEAAIKRSESSAECSWSFHMDGTWQDYKTWTKVQLLPEFKLTVDDDRQMIFLKQTAGDAFSVQIEHDPSDQPLRIHVHFVGMPD